ncbi:MAG: response regulator transcription factor [Bacteroidales bacterium]|nr:response regulator transcription factor [Bacteroidales bacterium]
MKTRILYVEDEPFLGRIVSETLQQQGFEIQLVADGALVIKELRQFKPELCVLDIMLPHVDGYTLCREIRAESQSMPIIFLTALSETEDLVKGFEAGGTDYIKKPFSMEELIIRIKNQLNLSERLRTNASSDKKLGKFMLSTSRYELITPTTTHKLSSREMEIASLLTETTNKVIDRRDILMKVWGDDSFFNSRTLDVYIRKLRSLFAEDPQIELITLKGKGYLFMIRN